MFVSFRCNPGATAKTRHGKQGLNRHFYPHRWDTTNLQPPYVGHENYGDPIEASSDQAVVGSNPAGGAAGEDHRGLPSILLKPRHNLVYK